MMYNLHLTPETVYTVNRRGHGHVEIVVSTDQHEVEDIKQTSIPA